MSDSVLLIDKPKGMTSHDVVDEVRRITGERRVGHAGTLDPMATGLLIVLVGREATRRQAEFMGLEKEYEAEITFGAVSDTYDAEGKTAVSCQLSAVGELSRGKVEGALKGFVGAIRQRVPPYAAVKVGGKKLYEYAREGKLNEVRIPTRRVEIKEIELLDFSPVRKDPSFRKGRVFPSGKLPKAEIRVVCSKGTYIRSLAHDLGQKLGVGAYLSALRRTRIGPYHVGEAVSLGELESSI